MPAVYVQSVCNNALSFSQNCFLNMTVLHIKLAQEASLKFDDQASDSGFVRQFTGIAHSGQVFTKWGDRYIVDLSNIQYRAKTGVLLEHDPNQKVGVGALSVSPQGLQIDGTLLSTEQGKHVAATADEGYPWELSAYIQSARQEQLREGEMVVNGVTVAAPIVILRDCSVREVSFVAVGADAHTNAVVLSDGTDFKPDFSLSNQAKENTMTEADFAPLQASLNRLQIRLGDLSEPLANIGNVLENSLRERNKQLEQQLAQTKDKLVALNANIADTSPLAKNRQALQDLGLTAEQVATGISQSAKKSLDDFTLAAQGFGNDADAMAQIFQAA
ncbi:MAG: hypothetical protein Q4B82_09335 [Alysiella sp.]|uniref:hypothetical protein n=1 Tax=Alysiella sp. TaxID=1872483 RepID=UPI0026DD4342|nr:hypothetical protein [Alysiella sp.]MDO4434762.1 hypothetical protein [Alysiella sp.]